MIEWSNSVKKDFKRVKANPKHAKNIDQFLEIIFSYLVEDKQLPEIYRDHALVGNWYGCRECHIKPNLLLIYDTEDPDILRLARLGSHSELFNR